MNTFLKGRTLLHFCTNRYHLTVKAIRKKLKQMSPVQTEPGLHAALTAKGIGQNQPI